MIDEELLDTIIENESIRLDIEEAIKDFPAEEKDDSGHSICKNCGAPITYSVRDTLYFHDIIKDYCSGYYCDKESKFPRIAMPQ